MYSNEITLTFQNTKMLEFLNILFKFNCLFVFIQNSFLWIGTFIYFCLILKIKLNLNALK